MDSVFSEMENATPEIKYIFLVTPIILIFMFTKINVQLNAILGLFTAGLIILYVNYRHQKEQKEITEIYNFKKDLLRPKSDVINRYDVFVDFLFSIQDLYAYNPPAYESLVQHLSDFLLYYEDSKIATELAGINYDLADERRSSAVNNLHSIIYSLPTNNIIIDKLNKAVEKLNDLLLNMLYELYTINNIHQTYNGFNTSSKVIRLGPKEANYYNSDAPAFSMY